VLFLPFLRKRAPLSNMESGPIVTFSIGRGRDTQAPRVVEPPPRPPRPGRQLGVD